MANFFRRHSIPIVLFFCYFVTFSYFCHTKPGWNINSRLALTFAIVEQHTFAIDDYHAAPFLYTEDKAYYKGHFYCDKAPALSFLAVPVYYVLWQAKMALGFFSDLPQSDWILTVIWILTATTVGLSGAIAGVLLWSIARKFGASAGISAVLSVAILCGTFLFGYATLFFAYLPGIACYLGAYRILLSDRSVALSHGPNLFFSGLLLGLAWFFEFTIGLLGIGLGVYAFWIVRRKPFSLWKFIVGGLISVAVFFAYTHHIFGEFSIPYKYEYNETFREEMSKGFQGIHLPRLSVLYYITIHPFKGVFFFSPVLVLWFVAVWRALRCRGANCRKPDVLLSIFVVAAYLAFSSGYYMWWGGWASGARNFFPAIPFFIAPIALYFSVSGKRSLWVFGFLFVLSVALNTMITAVDPQVPPRVPSEILMQARVADNYPSPILSFSLPAFLSGEIGPNLGMVLFGLPGLWSLMPLAVMWLVAGVWIFRRNKAVSQAKELV